MRVVLVTVGDPERVSGGFLYQRRLRERAADHDATLRFDSIPARPLPWAVGPARGVLAAAARDADVLVIDSLAASAVAPWIRSVRHRPLVGSVHQAMGGGDANPLRRAVTAWGDRRVWRACAALVVPSQHLADQLAAAGVVGPRIAVIEPGRDVAPQAPAAATAGDEIVVLCVANWLPRKGIVELIDAVAALDDQRVRLHLVGDEHVGGAYRDAVIARLASSGLAERTVRHGLVPPEAVAARYAAADVFALASHEESYGMVYGEALAAGLPIVSWDAGNVVNLVTDGVEGRLAPFGDIPALTAALAAVVGDPARRGAMSAAARRRGARRPTWDDAAAEFFALCRQISVLH